ncbi:hypothetical protein SteCoe_26142 [Stentor coeruleus]|uniref:Uncharacterized protein n=1 Tax=Stentor coeruleus TaxID=5963 RepID=A0A1R2BDI8_9CILI|nr:hypothetical protein SteCoe_26142 [Stentor coeruleus]
MGAILAKILNYHNQENQKKILVLGEDSAGKTTFLYKLNSRDVKTEMPIFPINLESTTYNNLKIVCCDTLPFDRDYKFRLLHPETYGIIFMFDVTDEQRFDDVLKELKTHINQPDMLGLPVLIICNKIDLKIVVSIERVKENVIPILEGRVWEIMGTSVVNDVGVKESISWISNAVENNLR